MPNVTEDSFMELWKYDPESRRKALYEKFSKAIAKEETRLGVTCKAPTNWSLEYFVDNYLSEIEPYSRYKKPDNWTIHNLIENNEHALFHPYVFEDYLKKYEIEDDMANERTKEPPEGWTFKDFLEKYEAKVVWDQVHEEGLTVGRNDTHDRKLFSLIKDLDSTDELLNLTVPGSGRRWNNQWEVPQPPGDAPKADEPEEAYLGFMRQAIYMARERMTVMQKLRKMYKERALYKMGYLFAKTDYACKIFSSLAFKAFRACSMIKLKIFSQFRVFLHFMDIAYNIERLLARWFDVDILKDMLVSNDLIARKVILKDRNLTTPELVVQAFDAMFID